MSAKQIFVLLLITTVVNLLQQARAQQECLPLVMYMMNSGATGVSSPVLMAVTAVLALIIGVHMLDIASL